MKTDLKKVKENPYHLKYVKNQTPEICLVAVRQNGYVLQFVKNQTTEICLEAVKEDPYVIRYINDKNFKKRFRIKVDISGLKFGNRYRL